MFWDGLLSVQNSAPLFFCFLEWLNLEGQVIIFRFFFYSCFAGSFFVGSSCGLFLDQ